MTEPFSSPESAVSGLALRQKRMDMGLSVRDLARFLGISDSTLRIWEKSRIVKCQLSCRNLPVEFLNGTYDFRLKKLSSQSLCFHLRSDQSSVLRKLLDRILCTFRLCADRPDLQRLLIAELMKIPFHPPEENRGDSQL